MVLDSVARDVVEEVRGEPPDCVFTCDLARPAGFEPATYGLEVQGIRFSPAITHRYPRQLFVNHFKGLPLFCLSLIDNE